MHKYIDSCVYTDSYEVKNLLKLEKLLHKKLCKKTLLHIPKYKLKDILQIKKNCSDRDFFIPIFHVQAKINIEKQLRYFKKNHVKIIKIHPRFLNLDLKKEFKTYKKLFKYCEKNKIHIMFCSFISYDKKVLDYDFLDFISKLINLTKKIKIIIMHSGGTEILRFYERLRFNNNIILDLSYTAQHFMNSNLFKDIVFLINNFDKKIILGSDMPSKKILLTQKFLKKINNIVIKKKIENIAYKNLERLINGIHGKN